MTNSIRKDVQTQRSHQKPSAVAIPRANAAAQRAIEAAAHASLHAVERPPARIPDRNGGDTSPSVSASNCQILTAPEPQNPIPSNGAPFPLNSRRSLPFEGERIPRTPRRILAVGSIHDWCWFYPPCCILSHARKRHPFHPLFVDNEAITERLVSAMVGLNIPHFIGRAFHWTHGFVKPMGPSLRVFGAFSGFPC